MLGPLLGLISQDLALDLGSSRTRLHVRGAGVVVDVPTAVAVRTYRSGRREVIAFGEDARAMFGRTPGDVVATRPVRAGRIAEPELATSLVKHLVLSLHGRSSWVRPRLLVSVPVTAADPTGRDRTELCREVGAREVVTMPAPVAAALGCGLPVDTTAHLIVDVGAGTTEISVVCMREVIASTVLDVGGDVFDGAVLRLLKRDEALLVGQPTAEALKHRWRPADGVRSPVSLLAAGRCLRRGIPRSAMVDPTALGEAWAEPIRAIGAGVRRVLELTPPEIAQDVVDHGALLCGGGSRLAGLDVALRADTGLAVLQLTPTDSATDLDAPERAVIRGLGATLEGWSAVRRVA